MAGSEYYGEYQSRVVVNTPQAKHTREVEMTRIGLDHNDASDVELYLQMKARVEAKKDRELDPNVKSVMDKYELRARVGFEKYKTDTTRSDLSLQDWLTHLQEELMDATIYVERLKNDL